MAGIRELSDMEQEHDQLVAEPFVPDWEKEGYPRTLWQLYVRELQVKETPEVVNSAVVMLAAAGVTQEWQLTSMTQGDLEGVLPQSTHMREYLATKWVISQRSARSSASTQPEKV